MVHLILRSTDWQTVPGPFPESVPSILLNTECRQARERLLTRHPDLTEFEIELEVKGDSDTQIMKEPDGGLHILCNARPRFRVSIFVNQVSKDSEPVYWDWGLD
jgi:hypothetical protein